jgi:hypothetical protein
MSLASQPFEWVRNVSSMTITFNAVYIGEKCLEEPENPW